MLRLNSVKLLKMSVVTVVIALNAGLLLNTPPASASSGDCGTYCSGTDTNTATNQQGNGPQVYFGEVGTGNTSVGGSHPCPSDLDGMCFSTAGANSAQTRYNNNTGLGDAFYFQTYGPNSSIKPTNLDAYCWGQYQAINAVNNVENYFSQWSLTPDYSYIALDIESAGSYGWNAGSSYYSANRSTFDGFTNYVSGRASGDSSCNNTNPTWLFQYMLYASNETWYSLTGTGSNSSIPNTPIWTSAPACYSSSYPNTMGPAATGASGYPVWKTYSNYLQNWQFYQVITGCSSTHDWDIGYSTWYEPVFGTNFP